MMGKAQFLVVFEALCAGLPDWPDDHDPPGLRADGSSAVKWRQRGAHTPTLALSRFDALPATGKTLTIAERRLC
jgi:hypothetical protein